MNQPSALAKGILLGLANLAMIALGAGFMMSSVQSAMFIVIAVIMFGLIPAMLVGGVAGVIANKLEGTATMRTLVLLLIAALGVTLVGNLLEVTELILPAYAPTAVCASILERWTRPQSELPVARITA